MTTYFSDILPTLLSSSRGMILQISNIYALMPLVIFLLVLTLLARIQCSNVGHANFVYRKFYNRFIPFMQSSMVMMIIIISLVKNSTEVTVNIKMYIQKIFVTNILCGL